MVRGLLLVAEVVVASLGLYNLAVALAGWRQQIPAPRGPRTQRFRVVIPAHDEARVVAAVVGDIADQDYPAGFFSTWVVADRCTDDTAAIASAAGAAVAVREEASDGKGAALAWYLDQHSLDRDEALVVIDADNRAPADLLARLADEIAAGNQVLQAYLDVSNPDQSLLTTAAALSYWSSNRMVDLARTNLGWPSSLGGTGMCLTAPALDAAGGLGGSLVEDQDLSVRSFLAGYPVRWLHDLRISDEKPTEAGVAIRQRSRWAAGRRQVAKRWLVPLLKKATPASWDLALRLVQPSRIGVAMISALLAVLSALGIPLWPWRLWAGLALIQFLTPILFLARDGVPSRYLIRYPLLVLLPILKLPARLVRNQGWYHTPHQGGE